MALFAISDMHLSFGTNKPMDIFGWINYEQRMKENWEESVDDEDVVLIPGDVSWATYLSEAEADFSFINKLPGLKIILKGNHDYWWTTHAKLNQFVNEKGFSTIRFLHNNSFSYRNIGICGSRGWGFGNNAEEDMHIWKREINRVKLSLEHAKNYDAKICCLHYPPIDQTGGLSEEYMEIFKLYNVKKVCYGHIHNRSQELVIPDEVDGINFYLVSCNCLDFMPFKLSD